MSLRRNQQTNQTNKKTMKTKSSILALLLIICASTMAFGQCDAYGKNKPIEWVVGKKQMVKGKTHSEQGFFAAKSRQKKSSVFSTKRRYKLNTVKFSKKD